MKPSALQLVNMEIVSLSHRDLGALERSDSVYSVESKANIGFKVIPVESTKTGAGVYEEFKKTGQLLFQIGWQFEFRFTGRGSEINSEMLCTFLFPLKLWSKSNEKTLQKVVANAITMAYSTCRGALWATLNGRGLMLPGIDLRDQISHYFESHGPVKHRFLAEPDPKKDSG